MTLEAKKLLLACVLFVSVHVAPPLGSCDEYNFAADVKNGASCPLPIPDGEGADSTKKGGQ